MGGSLIIIPVVVAVLLGWLGSRFFDGLKRFFAWLAISLASFFAILFLLAEMVEPEPGELKLSQSILISGVG